MTTDTSSGTILDSATSTLRQGGFGPVSSVDELLDRLVVTRLWDKEGDEFNPDTFEKNAAEHVKNYEISKFGAIGGPGILDVSKNPIVIQNVALYMDVHFFQDRTSLKMYSVNSEGMKREMTRRGFSEVLVTHLTDPHDLPRSPDTPQETASRIKPVHLEDLLPPQERCKVPKGPSKTFVPNLYQAEGETYAAAVVRDYEVKVLDKKTFTSYSPFRKWTTEELRNKKLGGDSKLTNRRKAYWVVCKIAKPPAEIEESQKYILAKAKGFLAELGIPSPPNWEQLSLEEYARKYSSDEMSMCI
jgi:hypothetical protein